MVPDSYPLRIALVQTSLYWENKTQNLALMEQLLRRITPGTDLVILPEMFSTGFSMNSQALAEDMEGPTVSWMYKMAEKTQRTIIGSLIIKEDNHFYNRLVWMSPNGTYYTYDKRHLFRIGDEHKHYTAGHEKLLVEYKGWNICPLICYDLRFPVWSRNTGDTDVLLYVANWPHRRIQHWNLLLQARAIENQCYVLGVNRVGVDVHNIAHSGYSQIISPLGEVLAEEHNTEAIIEYTLDKQQLLQIRKSFPVLQDHDHFSIRNAGVVKGS